MSIAIIEKANQLHQGLLSSLVMATFEANDPLVARGMKRQTAAEMNRVSIAAFSEIPTDKRRTFIFDDGKEFSAHEQMAKALEVHCYFAHPYHSWERGLNEHTNGLIRQFFPKGTNFTALCLTVEYRPEAQKALP